MVWTFIVHHTVHKNTFENLDIVIHLEMRCCEAFCVCQ